MPSRSARSKLGPTIEGRRAVLEALRAGTEIERLIIADGIESGPQVNEILEMAHANRLAVDTIERNELDRSAHTKHHQGVVAVTPDVRYARIEDLLAVATARGEPPLVVVLDGIEDPHNLGAIVRTVECAGAHGVVIPERRAVGVTPGAIRAAAGATEHDLALMRAACSPKVQVKAAGGIRTLDALLEARAAGATRAGATRTVDMLEECKRRLHEV